MKKLCIVVMGLMVLAGCATQSGPKYEGIFVPKEYVNKFEPGVDEHTLRWIRPGIDAGKYNKFMVDYVIFALAPDAEYKGINAEEMKQLADAASKALVQAISSKYEVVSEPGPDVARVRFAIVDLKPSKPVSNAVILVVPIGAGMNLVKKGVTDEWMGSGMTKAELMIHDSLTGQVMVAAYADYSAAFTERFTKWGSVEDAFTKWGNQITNALTNLKAAKVKKEM